MTAGTRARLTAAGRPPRSAVLVATADESSAWYVPVPAERGASRT